MAKARQIPLLKPEHSAVNDVRMMQQLLQRVDFQMEYLHRQLPSKAEQAQIQTAGASLTPFQIDCNTNLIHKQECELLPEDASVIGCKDLSAIVTRHVTLEAPFHETHA